MIEIREGSAADRDAILALRARCFPDDDREKQDPRFWDWEFGSGRTFVAVDDNRVVAHLGFVPQLAMLAVDAMTDPDYRRQHLFTRVAEFARDALKDSVPSSCAFQIRNAVLPGMVRAGWRPVAKAYVMVRPLALRAAPGVHTEDPRPRGAEELVLSLTTHTRDFIRWRFFSNPLWRYDVHANDDAYVITRRTVLRGLDSIAIADLGWRADCQRAERPLLREIYARGRAEGANVAAMLITLAHPAFPMIVRSGFLPSPHRFRFLLNDFASQHAGRRKWPLTWADTDHL
jgi:hypothetical protein